MLGLNPWLGIAALVVALLAMLGGLRLLARRFALHPELSRKLAHVGLGLATLTFPWLFDQVWPVLLVCGLAVVTLALLRYVPALRQAVGGVVHGVDRSSAGDLYFPLAATGLFLLARGDWVLFTIPILTLAFADAVAALIGVFYGSLRYEGAEGPKSLEGSVAFLLVAFLATHVPLLLFTDTGRAESLLIGLTFGLLVMLLEAVAWRGLDNLFIPFGGFLLLRAFLTLDAPALLARLGATLALFAVVFLLRRQKTLTDAAVLAGVLVGYVAWSVGGWAWVVPPAALFLLYTLLWPRAGQLRERPHDLVAVFSVTGCGMLWLLLATILRRPEYYLPYTVSFAANLGFIGITWWCDYRRSASRARGVLVSVGAAWVAFFAPYVAVLAATGDPMTDVIAHLGLALAALLAGGFMFMIVVPHRHHRPSREFPWARQALLALATSALGLAAPGLMEFAGP